MKNLIQKPIAKRLKNATPQQDMDDLAKKWVDMLFETLMTKKAGGLQKTDFIPKLDTA